MGILSLLLNNAMAHKEKPSERRNNFQVCFSANAPFINFCNIYFVKKFWSQNQSLSRKKSQPTHKTKNQAASKVNFD